jgi:hypothetical protein
MHSDPKKTLHIQNKKYKRAARFRYEWRLSMVKHTATAVPRSRKLRVSLGYRENSKLGYDLGN